MSDFLSQLNNLLSTSATQYMNSSSYPKATTSSASPSQKAYEAGQISPVGETWTDSNGQAWVHAGNGVWNRVATNQNSAPAQTPSSNTGSSSSSSNSTGSQTTQAAATPVDPKSIPGYVNVDPNWFKMPDQTQQDKWLSDAMAKLKPYYQKLLDNANGDLKEAQTRLDYDYNTGSRYNQEDFATLTGRANEDAVSSLKSLGLTINNENEQQTDTQNKRGIALNQNENNQVGVAQPGMMTYDSSGNPVVTGTGRAGVEKSMLQEDQSLRREAINRSKNRALQDIGINTTRKSEDLANTKATGTYDATAGFRDKQISLDQEQSSKAAAMAESSYNRDMQQKSLSLQQASLDAQNKALSSS